MTKKNTKKSSTLTKVATRLLLTFALVLALVATSITPAFAETVSETYTVIVNGVKYTPFLKQGQAQLTVGDKAIILSKENVMTAVIVDQYGTAWTISNSGRCAGYNYELQKNEPTANLHTYVNNAEQFVTSGNYGTAVKTTTGTVNLPNLEEFKKLAGITSSNNNSTNGDNTNNTGNNNSNTNPGNNTNDGNNANTGVSGNLNLVETTKVGDTQYTFVVTNGIAQVVKDGKVITIPDKNISEIGIDANGTIIIITNNNGVKEARWYNPTLQTKEVKTNLLTSNANCLIKDSNKLVTGVLSNSTIVKVLTVDEQKKVLGIVPETKPESVTVKVDESRVIKKGDYTYVVYDSNGKEVTRFKFKDGVLTWRGVKYKNIKRVGVIEKSKNLIMTSSLGNIFTIDFETMEVKRIFAASESKGKAKKYSRNSRGYVIAYITTKGSRKNVKNY